MIDITNVVNISVSAPPAGLAPYSVNNLACLTKDTQLGNTGADFNVYTNPTDVEADWGSNSATYKAALAAFAQSPNILTGGGRFITVPIGATGTLSTAISKVKDQVFFGGVGYTHVGATGVANATGQTGITAETTEAAVICQSLRKLLFVASSDPDDLETGGLLHNLQGASLSYARTLYYGDQATLPAYKWGYAGRALSTNFAGSGTTQTMALKQIAGAVADETINSTVLTAAQTVGADVYPNIAGRASLQSFGANEFYDDVYNLTWFVRALEVAGFNFLAQTSTKIPQTEIGMTALKGAYRAVCEQALTNRFIGAGSWTSGDTFGDPEDFRRNIAERGYFVYSSPVALQSPADRALRKAPIIQIAVKYQGAIHTSDVIIFVNK